MKKTSVELKKTPYDKHHILYIKEEWNKHGLEELRVHPYCIIKMERNTIHKYIHSHLAYIPVPREYSAKTVLFHLECLEKYGVIGLEDTIEKRLSVLIALFECVEQPTADALREQLELVHEFKKGLL